MMGPRGFVRNLLHLWKADIVCLQETKVAKVVSGEVGMLIGFVTIL